MRYLILLKMIRNPYMTYAKAKQEVQNESKG